MNTKPGTPNNRAIKALAGILDPERVALAWDEHLQRQQPLVRILVDSGAIDEETLLRQLAPRLGLTYCTLHPEEIQGEALRKLDVGIATHYGVLPVRIQDEMLAIATSDPFAYEAFDELREITGMNLNLVVSAQAHIDLATRKLHGLGADTAAQMVAEEGIEIHVASSENTDLADQTASADASVMKFVNLILMEAIKSESTDIHIEPYERDLRVRYRIDGFLQETSIPSTMWHFRSAIASRIKIMAGLDIAEKRLPQEGRIDVTVGGREYDLRVSVLPSSYGEAVNLRILPRGSVLFSMDELGVAEHHLAIVEELIHKPHGIILVTGPTGSGKTTSLYAALNKINSPDKKIVTIEDPIEYDMHGITQMQVHPKIGFTFGRALRSVLRHDPDVILVGEVRDRETAEIAVRTALTGHLVFTTLHTNDAASAITRLLDMGVEPFLCSSSILAVLAQRLVRRLCVHCKEEVPWEEKLLQEIGVDDKKTMSASCYDGKGCSECRYTGYHGRTAIYEIMRMDDEIREMTLSHTPANVIREAARKKGMQTLRENGLEKILAGTTSFREIARLTQE